MPNHYFGNGTTSTAFDDFFKKIQSSNQLLDRLGSPEVGSLFENVSKAANQFGALGGPFTAPTGFSPFAKQVGTTAGQIGSFEGGLDLATKQAEKLGTALQGGLKTATQLGGGSFGGETFGGVIPEAQAQAGVLGEGLSGLAEKVPDISPSDVLPTQFELQKELGLRTPGGFGAGQFIPTKTALSDELALRRPGAMGAGQFLPTQLELQKELGLRTPGGFGAGQFLPTGTAISDELAIPQPGAFGAGQFLPTGDALTDELGLRRRSAFGAGQFLPTGDALTDELDLRRPDPWAVDPFLPTAEAFQEELDRRRPLGFTDAGGFLETDAFAGEDDEGGEESGTRSRQRNVVQQQAKLDEYLAKLREAIDGVASGPTTAQGLREDPLTTSLMLDLKAQQIRDRRQAEEDLQRMGVMRSGDTADVLGELTAGQQRAEMDLIADAAERFRKDRMTGLATGVDLFGAAGQRELGLGQLGLQGEQLDLDILAAATSLLDPNMKLGGTASQKMIAQLLLKLTNIPQGVKDSLINAVGWIGVRD